MEVIHVRQKYKIQNQRINNELIKKRIFNPEFFHVLSTAHILILKVPKIVHGY